MPTDTIVPSPDHGRTETGPGRSALRDLVPATVLLLAGLAGLVAASLADGEDNGQYLVVTAPWSDLGTTIGLIGVAEGAIVEAGRFQNIAIAASSDPEFVRRAREAGAWLVLPSPGLAGCFGVTPETLPQ